MYLLGCMYLCCLTVVHVQKILPPCLDLLKIVPLLLHDDTLNVLDTGKAIVLGLLLLCFTSRLPLVSLSSKTLELS